MTWTWLSNILEISEIIKSLNTLISGNRAMKDALLRELKINLHAYKIAQENDLVDYDKLFDLLKNDKIIEARESQFVFSSIKTGKIKEHHIKDTRNQRYVGKDVSWLFKNIDEKIEDLRNQKVYYDSLNQVKSSNIGLQFSNLFYKMKLLVDFIND